MTFPASPPFLQREHEQVVRDLKRDCERETDRANELEKSVRLAAAGVANTLSPRCEHVINTSSIHSGRVVST